MAELPIRYSSVGGALPTDSDTRQATAESQRTLQQLWDAVNAAGSSINAANVPNSVPILLGNTIGAFVNTNTVLVTGYANGMLSMEANIDISGTQKKLYQSIATGSIDIFDGNQSLAGLLAGNGITIGRSVAQNMDTIGINIPAPTNAFASIDSNGHVIGGWLRYLSIINKVAVVDASSPSNVVVPSTAYVLTNAASDSAVNFANFSTNAIHADAANNAGHTPQADNANHALQADNANTSSHAANADYATNAGYSTDGAHAANANYAINAGYAVNANYAPFTNHAIIADQANLANVAYQATNANYATNAGNANYAQNIPIATHSALGGVVAGSTMLIAANGVLDIPAASTTVLGGVKVDGLTITINSNNVISSSALPSLTNTYIAVGNAINRLSGSANLSYDDVTLHSAGSKVALAGALTPANYGLAIGLTADAAGTESIAIGEAAKSNSVNAITLGLGAKANGVDGIAIGSNANFAGFHIIAGPNTVIDSGSIAIGVNSFASDTAVIAIGRQSQASSYGGIAIGAGANGGIAIGVGSYASFVASPAPDANAQSIAIGALSNAAYGFAIPSIAIGGNATSNGGIAIGTNAKSQGIGCLLIGKNTFSNSPNSIIIGPYASSLDTYDATLVGEIALGYGAHVRGNYSIAIGANSWANQPGSIAIGAGVVVNTANKIVIGNTNTNTSIPGTLYVNGVNVSNYIAYVLPTATDTVLGGIKVGTTLSIANGVLNYTNPNPTPYVLPAATSSTLGGVIAGPNLTIAANGRIDYSNPNPTPYALPTATNVILGGIKIGPNLSIVNGVVDYSNPNPTPYILPVASTTVLGGVKVDGTTITADGSGVITAASQIPALANTYIGVGNTAGKLSGSANLSYLSTLFFANASNLSLGLSSSVANSVNAVAVGPTAQAVSGPNAIAIGTTANAGYSTNPIAIGTNAKAVGDNSIAIGTNANVQYIAGFNGSIAIGLNAFAANRGVAVGPNASTDGGIAIGANTNAANNSIAIGKGINVTAVNTIQLGISTHTVNIPGTLYVNGVNINGVISAVALGNTFIGVGNSTNNLVGSSALSFDGTTLVAGGSRVALAGGSAINTNDLAIGYGAVANGLSSGAIAYGFGSNATGQEAIAIGSSCLTNAYSFAMGRSSAAYGGTTTAIGHSALVNNTYDSTVIGRDVSVNLSSAYSAHGYVVLGVNGAITDSSTQPQGLYFATGPDSGNKGFGWSVTRNTNTRYDMNVTGAANLVETKFTEYNLGTPGATLTIDWHQSDFAVMQANGNTAVTLTNAYCTRKLLRLKHAGASANVTLVNVQVPGVVGNTNKVVFLAQADGDTIVDLYCDGTNYHVIAVV